MRNQITSVVFPMACHRCCRGGGAVPVRSCCVQAMLNVSRLGGRGTEIEIKRRVEKANIGGGGDTVEERERD